MHNMKSTEINLATTTNFDDFFSKVTETFSRDVAFVTRQIFVSCKELFNNTSSEFLDINVYNKGCKIGNTRVLKDKNRRYCKKVVKKAIDSIGLSADSVFYVKNTCSISICDLLFSEKTKNKVKEHLLKVLLKTPVDFFTEDVEVYVFFDASYITFKFLTESVQFDLDFSFSNNQKLQKKMLEEALDELLSKHGVMLKQHAVDDTWTICMKSII